MPPCVMVSLSIMHSFWSSVGYRKHRLCTKMNWKYFKSWYLKFSKIVVRYMNRKNATEYFHELYFKFAHSKYSLEHFLLMKRSYFFSSHGISLVNTIFWETKFNSEVHFKSWQPFKNIKKKLNQFWRDKLLYFNFIFKWRNIFFLEFFS